MTTKEIESAVVSMLNPHINTVVPNVSWSLFRFHEADLVSLTPAGYGTEIEIKISVSDLRADKKKVRWRFEFPSLIKYMWFAGPEKMRAALLLHAPEFAGVMIVKRKWGIDKRTWRLTGLYRDFVEKVRKPKINRGHRKWTTLERMKFLRLAYIRFVRLKWYP